VSEISSYELQISCFLSTVVFLVGKLRSASRVLSRWMSTVTFHFNPFHPGGSKPEVVFASGSWLLRRGSLVDTDFLRLSQSSKIQQFSTVVAANWMVFLNRIASDSLNSQRNHVETPTTNGIHREKALGKRRQLLRNTISDSKLEIYDPITRNSRKYKYILLISS